MFNFNQYKLRFRNLVYNKHYCVQVGYVCLYISWRGTKAPTRMKHMDALHPSGEILRHVFIDATDGGITDRRAVSHQLYCSEMYKWIRNGSKL